MIGNLRELIKVLIFVKLVCIVSFSALGVFAADCDLPTTVGSSTPSGKTPLQRLQEVRAKNLEKRTAKPSGAGQVRQKRTEVANAKASVDTAKANAEGARQGVEETSASVDTAKANAEGARKRVLEASAKADDLIRRKAELEAKMAELQAKRTELEAKSGN
jgi:membrane protein involved in colicin uptake